MYWKIAKKCCQIFLKDVWGQFQLNHQKYSAWSAIDEGRFAALFKFLEKDLGKLWSA